MCTERPLVAETGSTPFKSTVLCPKDECMFSSTTTAIIGTKLSHCCSLQLWPLILRTCRKSPSAATSMMLVPTNNDLKPKFSTVGFNFKSTGWVQLQESLQDTSILRPLRGWVQLQVYGWVQEAWQLQVYGWVQLQSLRLGSTSNLRLGSTSNLRFSTSNLRLGSTSNLRLGSTSSLRLGSTSSLRLGSTSNLRLGSTSNLRLGSTSKLRSTSSLHMIIVMWSLAVSHPLCEIIWAYVLSSQFHCAESQVHLNENYIFHRQVQIMIVCMINGMHMKMWSPVWQAFQPTALFFLAPDMCRNDIHWSL